MNWNQSGFGSDFRFSASGSVYLDSLLDLLKPHVFYLRCFMSQMEMLQNRFGENSIRLLAPIHFINGTCYYLDKYFIKGERQY